jgi:hypothetical protein
MLLTRKMQIKTTTKYQFTLIRIETGLSDNRNVEGKLEVTQNVHMQNDITFLKINLTVFCKVKHTFTIDIKYMSTLILKQT